MNWIEDTKDGVVLRVFAQPKSATNQIIGFYGEPARLKIRVAAPPREGEANEALIKFLKSILRQLHVQVTLLRGDSNRRKDVLIQGSTKENIEKILTQNIA